ncbi:cell division protein FtsK/SpoIIIE [Bacillus phage SP-15]|uniref:Cell division protein FtsK/SpoIIIE n=1 Tax=Bacillus phage SP-15 TaxID=1792032 RepID=A0A127AW94_9CAUD|nr:FtsK/SpoIIIE-like protein [Bacillus phage SP-15]AMM44959.1 cell division protein FtsK/SpoIIIE [Bacillus phage SP-15]
MLLEGGLLAAGLSIWGLYKYETNPSTQFKRKLNDAMNRAGLRFKFKNKSGHEVIERPVLLSIEPSEYGWKTQFRLPVGMVPDDIVEAKAVLEGAINAELDLDYEGQLITINFYTHPIPEPGSEAAMYSKSLVEQVQKYPLGIPIGHSKVGFIVHDLSEGSAPHLLVGGQTGMGKSNILNLIITTLIKAYSKDHVHIHLIDTKMVEFFKFKNLDHVRSCSIDISDGVKSVTNIQRELRERQKLLMTSGYSNILDYNRDSDESEKLPFIVLIVDEFGDFQGVSDFWKPVDELGRKGRAMGIHVILSTQRPDAQTLPPKVKANLAGVVCLKTKTKSNSQILLDSTRAFKLPLKKGRALFQLDGLREVQIPYIEEKVLEEQLGILINKRFRKRNGEVVILDPSERDYDRDVVNVTPNPESDTEYLNSASLLGISGSAESHQDLTANKVQRKSLPNPESSKSERSNYIDTVKEIEKLEAQAFKYNEEMNDLGRELYELHSKYISETNSRIKSQLSKSGLEVKEKYENLQKHRDDLLLKSTQLRKTLGKK